MRLNGLNAITLISFSSLAVWLGALSAGSAMDGRLPSSVPVRPVQSQPTQPTPTQPAQFVQPKSPQLQSFAFTRPNLQGLQRYARAITVKVMSGEDWGSGILIQRQNQTYTVLTNEHVLWIGDRFVVQTLDGKQYTASRDVHTAFGTNDLGTLRFTATTEMTYPVASLGCSLSLKAGTPVYAAGFPMPLTERSTKGFKFTKGAISLITPKALEGGYQVGYSNDIEKGMSGGPVLNARGDVIAVNGMHQEPLWGDPYVFQDGSKPSDVIHNLLFYSSWAIPMETVLRTPMLASIPSQHCVASK